MCVAEFMDLAPTIKQHTIMKKAIRTTHTLNASPEAIWDRIKSGQAWETWMPILTSSHISGNSRICHLDNGDELEERFLVSEAEKTFMYSIERQSSFPAENLTGIIQLETDGEKTLLQWSLDLDVESEDVYDTLRPQIEEIYGASAKKLDELIASSIAA